MPTVSVKKQKHDGSPSEDVDVVIEAKVGQTVFDELEAHGHKLPHGCLGGSCGACRMIVLKGSEFLASPDQKETKTLNIVSQNLKNKFGENYLNDKVIRLSCQTKFIEEDGEIEIVPAP